MNKISSLVFLCFFFFTFVPQTPLLAQSTLNYTDASIHFRNGQEYFESRNYEAARAEFTLFLDYSKTLLDKEDANKVWAEYYVVMCSLYLDYAETELLANRFVRNYPEHPVAGHLYKEIGNYFFTRGDYSRAVDYLRKSPKSDEDAQYRLAISYFSLQDYSEAIVIFDDLKDGSSKNAIPSSYYSAIINFRAGRYQESIPDFKKAEQSPEYRSEIPGWLAHSYYRQGKFAEMLAYTEPLLREKNTGRKLEDVALLTAEVYFQQINYGKAASYYSIYKNYKSQVMLPAVAYRYGYSLYKTDQFALATEQLKNIAAIRDTLGQHAAFILGVSYLKANNPNYALGAFDQARKSNYNKSVTEDADFNHAKVLLDLNRGNEAIKALEVFFKSYPNTKYEDEAHELVSEAYLASNNYQAALAYIEGLPRRSTRTNSAYQRIAYNQGVKLFNDERFVDAIPYFDKSLTTPTNSETKYSANFWKAEALSADKKYIDAIPLYHTIIASVDNTTPNLNELQSRSRYSLAYSYYNTKDYSKANIFFREYAERMKLSGDSQAYQDAVIRLGDTYFASKSYDSALKYYDQAISSKGADRDYATYQKGLVMVLKGNEAGARAAFRKVQSDFPQSLYFDNAIYQEANVDFTAGRYIPAITGFTKLLSDKPQSALVPAAFLKRAVAFQNTLNHEGAIADFKSILKNYSTEPQSKDALAAIQEELNEVGRPEEFTQILNDYQLANPLDNSVIGLAYDAAKSLYFNDKYTKAIPALIEYVRKNPTSLESYEAKYFIAEAYYKSGNVSEALNWYYLVIKDRKYKAFNKAILRAAEIEFAAGNFKGAINNYRNLLVSASDKKDQQTALIALMQSYYQTTKLDSALYFAKEVSTSGDVVLGAKSMANLLMGKIYMAKNDYSNATLAFDQTIALAKDDFGAEAQYLIAQMLYNQKKYKESSEMIITKFRNEFSDAADKIVGRAYLLLADDFVGLDNVFQAKATLNSLIDNLSDKDIVAESKTKLKLLEKK